MPGTSEMPTPQLRFVRRQVAGTAHVMARLILQQRWTILTGEEDRTVSSGHEWRDVPLVEEIADASR